MNRILFGLLIIAIIAVGILGHSTCKLRKEKAIYVEAQTRLEKEIKYGWIVVPQGAFVLTPIDQHEACMGCHTRNRVKMVIPEGLECPHWQMEVNNEH